MPVVAGGLNPSTYHNIANTNAPVITISASGANAGFVNLWHIPVWSSDSSFIDDTITQNIYFWYVMLKKRQQEIFDSQTGSAQPHIYPQHIELMSISDIKIDAITEFNKNVTPLFQKIGENTKENSILTQLRDTLLPKLMSGEIDVSNVEIDDVLTNKLYEPASKSKLSAEPYNSSGSFASASKNLPSEQSSSTDKLSFSGTVFICFGLEVKFFILVLKNKNNNLHLIVKFILLLKLNYKWRTLTKVFALVGRKNRGSTLKGILIRKARDTCQRLKRVLPSQI